MNEPWLAQYVPTHARMFVDVGANEGQWTKAFATRFIHVHAIEPNADAIVKLRQGLSSNVTVHEIAAWSRSTKMNFGRFTSNQCFSGVFVDGWWNCAPKTGEVFTRCEPLDSLGLKDVDLIKIDAEGGEVEVFLGALQTIQRDHPKIVIEVHVKEYVGILKTLSELLGYHVTLIHNPFQVPTWEHWDDHLHMYLGS